MNTRQVISGYLVISGTMASSLILARIYTGHISGLAVSAHIRDTIRECVIIGCGWPIMTPFIVWKHHLSVYTPLLLGGKRHVANHMHVARLLFPFGWRAPLLMGRYERTALLYKLGVIRAEK